MPGSTSLRLITTPQQRRVTERLWQLYHHDLSEFRGSMPGGEGLYKPGQLPTFFEDPDRCGYLIYSDQALAGFALIRGLTEEQKVVGEFFVVRAIRRQRVGYEAAMALLRLHPGRWAIPFQEENQGAARFWRRVAADAARAACEEEERPVPGKPEIPPDTWLLLSTRLPSFRSDGLILAGVRSRDGPLSVRRRPSSVKGTRRSFQPLRRKHLQDPPLSGWAQPFDWKHRREGRWQLELPIPQAGVNWLFVRVRQVLIRDRHDHPDRVITSLLPHRLVSPVQGPIKRHAAFQPVCFFGGYRREQAHESIVAVARPPDPARGSRLWTVNTSPAFAAKVRKAVGGQILLGPEVVAASPAPEPSSAEAEPTMTSQSDVIVFKVHGTGYPSVLYGTDSDNRTPTGGYGPLGDGVALPWSATMTYDSTALYYAVTAQLQGSGDISDTVTEVVTTHCSDGSSKMERFPLASGHASGGYSIARAEYAGEDTGNAAQAESDAGC